MENASKALLIAGAVLIAIVLVTLGIVILGNTDDTTDSAKKTGNEINDQSTESVNTMKNVLNNM